MCGLRRSLVVHDARDPPRHERDGGNESDHDDRPVNVDAGEPDGGYEDTAYDRGERKLHATGTASGSCFQWFGR